MTTRTKNLLRAEGFTSRQQHRLRCLLASMRPAAPSETTLDYVAVIPVISCDECEGEGELPVYGACPSGQDDSRETCPHCREGEILDPEDATLEMHQSWLRSSRRTFQLSELPGGACDAS